MEVYIVGSLRFQSEGQPKEQQEQPKPLTEEQNQEQRKFIAASKALGYALAEAGHTIRVGLVQWEKLADGSAIAGHVIDGANEAGGTAQKENPSHL